MKRARFLDRRRADWRKFEALLTRAERHRTPRFNGEEVQEFSRLFRAVCHDLATVRSRDWGGDIEGYLNDLVARGHNNFYRSPPARGRVVLEFFAGGFPRLLRENFAYFCVALALFVIPGVIAGTAVGHDPELATRVLPGSVLEQFDEMYARENDEGSRAEGMMTGFYVYNNVGIAFRCFATGILFGIGTVFFLVYNSIFFGAITAYIVEHGYSENFFSFVITHGSFELTAIVISGAAGLIIGHALVHPGQETRLRALLLRGRVGIQLAAGAGAMLVVAALIEAFWSPSPAPASMKFAVGGVCWFLVALYLALGGRSRANGVAAPDTGRGSP